jgi:hypothetical protein
MANTTGAYNLRECIGSVVEVSHRTQIVAYKFAGLI